MIPTLIEARVLASRSAKLHWTIAYSQEHEQIEGFFVGYRSFEPSTSVSNPANIAGQQPISDPIEPLKHKTKLSASGSLTDQKSTQSTFTYKTIRLTNHRLDSSSLNEQATFQRKQDQQADSSDVLLAPISSITKTVPITSPFAHLGGPNQAPTLVNGNQAQLLLVQTFEFVIGSLERDTEYTVLLQCFNKKGAGPTSDPVVFRTFANGKIPTETSQP